MIFRDMELDFDIFDAETADLYEEAAKTARDEAVKKAGETLGDAIRRQCNAVFNFFDTIFGEGFHRELFGSRTNLMECIGAFRDFIKAVDEQKAALDTMMEEVEADTVAAPNRAARRAALKTAKQ
ncbi:MAG: DUF6673 family protein [Pseudoflavonifractor sp.]